MLPSPFFVGDLGGVLGGDLGGVAGDLGGVFGGVGGVAGDVVVVGLVGVEGGELGVAVGVEVVAGVLCFVRGFRLCLRRVYECTTILLLRRPDLPLDFLLEVRRLFCFGAIVVCVCLRHNRVLVSHISRNRQFS